MLAQSQGIIGLAEFGGGNAVDVAFGRGTGDGMSEHRKTPVTEKKTR
jgi:hypothetical protein